MTLNISLHAYAPIWASKTSCTTSRCNSRRGICKIRTRNVAENISILLKFAMEMDMKQLNKLSLKRSHEKRMPNLDDLVIVIKER